MYFPESSHKREFSIVDTWLTSQTMVSLFGDQHDSGNRSSLGKSSGQPNDAVGQIDTEQMFNLIDRLLPFEVCLYHQILPLSVEGSRLNLGMVNPHDQTATDYVRRILTYMNCTLVTRRITSELHQSMLSSYLSRGDRQSAARLNKATSTAGSAASAPPSAPKSAASSANPAASASAQPYRPEVTKPLTSQPNLPEQPQPSVTTKPIHQPTKPAAKPPLEVQATLILDGTEEIKLPDKPDREAGELSAINGSTIPPEPPPPPLMTTPTILQSVTSNIELSPTAETVILDPKVVPPPNLPNPTPKSNTLELQVSHLSSPIEVLGTLQPQQLLKELLARVFLGGIGRLYLERKPQSGRILWSQNGVLQSVLEGLSVETLQGVINELKAMANLAIATVDKPQQVEVERNYQGSRLLLRLRVMPGTYGEEATLQVLRGAALKFYEQQQLDKLGRDALSIAQQLQRKVDEIQERSRANRESAVNQLEALPAINQLLRVMEQQLQELERLYGEQNS